MNGQNTPLDPHDLPRAIAGIGASAGGSEALEQFFANAQPGSGIAYVVITHQNPDHESLLPNILSRRTEMPVLEVHEPTLVRPDHIYIAPPTARLTIHDQRLELEELGEPPRLVIDAFLRALALDAGPRAVGVILSGTGTDGTLGLKEIRGAGGMTIVQDEAARFSGMPLSAIASVPVDYEGPVEELPRMIRGYLEGSGPPVRASLSEEHIAAICSVLASRTGHDLSLYKTSTVGRRIERRMRVHKITSPEDYLDLLTTHPEEVERLFEELLIGVTSFFRDPEAFAHLEHAIRALLSDKPRDYVFRAWVPACSTGEEAFSIAAIVGDVMRDIGRPIAARIFATDIGSSAIDLARAAVYPPNVAPDLSRRPVDALFVETGEGLRVKKEIRELVTFATHDLNGDPPFTRLDLISCRNLLIYFQVELQRRLMPVFHYALNPGGLLFLGPSETLGASSHLFEPVDRRWKIFRRAGAGSERYPDLPIRPRSSANEHADLTGMARRADARTSQLAERLLLSTRVPPTVFATEQGRIVHIHGRTGQFLEPAPGAQAEANILEMAREGLRSSLAVAIRDAARSGREVVQRCPRVRTNGDFVSVDLRVQRLTGPERLTGLLAIAFEIVASPEVADAAPEPAGIAELEQDLSETRAMHQNTIDELADTNEELRSANEELESANEELQSTNEELETSREELQSLNEELETVNAELQGKVDELYRVNDDMQNLLNSTDIATVFLDGELHIKRYTDQAVRVIRLIPSDVGRPIEDLVVRLRGRVSLAGRAREVLTSLLPQDAEVESEDGHWYLMRILPYRTNEGITDGLVLTFVDITKLRALREKHDRLVEALDESPACVFSQDRGGRYTWSASTVFGLGHVVGMTDDEILPPDQAARLMEIKRQVLDGGQSIRTRFRASVGGTERPYQLYLRPRRDDTGAIVGLDGVSLELEGDD